MPVGEGGFVWYELMTTDVASAERFYSRVVGWNAADAGMPGMRYTLFKIGDRPVAGLTDLPADGPPASWIGHIVTADVEATATRVISAGGSQIRPPADIPGIGRFAVMADPQGAAFILFRADGTPAPDLAPTTPGAVGWHELHTSDWQAAFAFYADLFGWEKSDAIDMGPAGTYQTFSIRGVWAGGIMNSPQPGSAPSWLFYATVEDFDAANRRIAESGGTTTVGPLQVPGGSWIVNALDPQGAAFALLGPRAASAA